MAKITSCYGDATVLCPFYKASDSKRISCEGVTEGSVIILSYASKEKKNKQKMIFCDRKYQNCEVYRMLEDKYAEE